MINRALGSAFDLLLRPLAPLPPLASLAVISLVTAVIMLLVVRRTSNQRRGRDLMEAIPLVLDSPV